MTITDVPAPEPDPGEVMLRSKSVGIDGGAEALIYEWHESWHHLESALPRIFGHEFAGVIDLTGADVEHYNPGDRVAVEPGAACGHCEQCLSGNRNLCPDRVSIGLDRNGALAEYVTVPEENLYRLTPEISFDEAAFLEILGVGMNALEQSTFQPGDAVGITGPGPVGIGILLAAATGGADAVYVLGAPIDADTRLPIADDLGATGTFIVGEAEMPRDVDIFFEASGQQTALREAVHSTVRGGEIIQVGIYHVADGVAVNLDHLTRREITLVPTYARRDSSWRRAISLGRRVDLSPLIGPTFALDEYEAAFDAVEQRAGIKVILHP